MATSFVLTLDTTAPQSVTFAVNAGAPYTTTASVTANISTGDSSTLGYLMKVWGDVDTTDDSDIQDTEGASSWMTYATTQSVTLSDGDGSKTLSFRLRDDVGNQTSVLTDSITLDTTLPTVTITVGVDPETISKVAAFDTATFSFQADTALQAWKVKVVSASESLENTGTTIPATAGSTNTTGASLAATTNQAVAINGADLETASAGDGDKIVKVFGRDVAGNWSV